MELVGWRPTSSWLPVTSVNRLPSSHDETRPSRSVTAPHRSAERPVSWSQPKLADRERWLPRNGLRTMCRWSDRSTNGANPTHKGAMLRGGFTPRQALFPGP